MPTVGNRRQPVPIRCTGCQFFSLNELLQGITILAHPLVTMILLSMTGIPELLSNAQ